MNVFLNSLSNSGEPRWLPSGGIFRQMTQAVFALLVLLIQPVTAVEAANVPLYDRFETNMDYQALTGQPHAYSDPFYGVELKATFTSPSGKTVSWWGFFDGDGLGGQTGNIWKLRYMPDELGTWTYTWQFSDSSANGSGSFVAVSTGARPGPLKHAADHHWAVTADGSKHVFYNMYAVGDVDQNTSFWNNPVASVTEATGYGFEILAYMSTQWYSNSDYHYWMNPDNSDFSPRLSMVHRMERLFQEAADRGVYIFDWDGFYVGNGAVNLDKQPLALQNAAIRYWMARTAPYYNTINNIAFEIPEFFDGNTNSAKSWALERISYFDSIDPWDHFISAHQDGFIGGTYYFSNNPSVDFTGVQDYDYQDYHAHALGWWNSSAEPIGFMSEGLWNAPWGRPGSSDAARKSYWELLTAGSGYFYFPRDDSQAITEAAAVQTFLNTSGARWWQMQPHDEVVNSGGAMALANIGNEYIVYDDSGNSFNMTIPSGSYTRRWFNPSTGVFQAPVTFTASGASETYAKPNSGAWVLHIQTSSADTIAPSNPQLTVE